MDPIDNLLAELAGPSKGAVSTPSPAGGASAVPNLDALLNELDKPVAAESSSAASATIPQLDDLLADLTAGAATAPSPRTAAAAPAPRESSTLPALNSLLSSLSEEDATPAVKPAPKQSLNRDDSLDNVLTAFLDVADSQGNPQALSSMLANLEGGSETDESAIAFLQPQPKAVPVPKPQPHQAQTSVSAAAGVTSPEIDAVLSQRVRSTQLVKPVSSDLHNYLLGPMDRAKAILAMGPGGFARYDAALLVRNTVDICNFVCDDLAHVPVGDVRDKLIRATLGFAAAANAMFGILEVKNAAVYPEHEQRLKIGIAAVLGMIREAASAAAARTASTAASAKIMGAPTCSACKQPCTEQYFQVSTEEVYHVACMTCAICGAPNAGYKLGNLLLCENDYRQQASQTAGLASIACLRCSEPITSTFVEIGSNVWHKDCFSCTKCAGDLSGGFLEINDMPYCANCG